MSGRLVGYRELTREQAEELREQRIPNAPTSAGTIAGNNFITMILNFLIQNGRKYLKFYVYLLSIFILFIYQSGHYL